MNNCNRSLLRFLHHHRCLRLSSSSGLSSRSSSSFGSCLGSGSLIWRLHLKNQLLLFRHPLRLGTIGYVCGHASDHVRGYASGHDRGHARGHKGERSKTSFERAKESITLEKLPLVFALSVFFACATGWMFDDLPPSPENDKHKTKQQQVDLSVFHPFEIISKQPVSSTCSIFTLRSQGEDTSNPYLDLLRDAWANGIGVWSVQVKQPQLQIARSYTPLPPLDKLDGASGDDSTTELRFLIRHEPQGEVSSYLHNLPLGATVHIRGLDIEYEVPSNINDIIFLAGGTGIAPALQIAYCLLERRRKSRRRKTLADTSNGSGASSDPGFQMPKMHILWANRKREDAIGGVSSTSSGNGFSSATLGRESWSERWTRFFFASAEQQQQQQHDDASPLARSSSSSSSSLHLPSSPIVTELNHLKYEAQGQITLDYFIDEEGTYITQDILRTYLSSFNNLEKNQRKKWWQWQRQPPDPQARSQTQTQIPPHSKKSKSKSKSKSLIMISGPDGFIAHHAGPKVWILGKHSQGLLGGNLGKVLGPMVAASSSSSSSASSSSASSKQKQDKQEQDKQDKQEQYQNWDIWKL